MPDTSGAINLGEAPNLTPEQEAQLREMAKDHPEDTEGPDRVVTAFGVVLTHDGQVLIVPFDSEDVVMDINPTPDLIHGMAATVQKDIASQDTARHTLELQMHQARAMSQRMEEAQIAAQLAAQNGGLRRG